MQRRPTEIVRHPPPIQKQPTKILQNDDSELVEAEEVSLALDAILVTISVSIMVPLVL